MFVFRAGRIRIVNTHNCSDCSELVATTSIYIYISIDTVFCPIKTQYFVLLGLSSMAQFISFFDFAVGGAWAMNPWIYIYTYDLSLLRLYLFCFPFLHIVSAFPFYITFLLSLSLYPFSFPFLYILSVFPFLILFLLSLSLCTFRSFILFSSFSSRSFPFFLLILFLVSFFFTLLSLYNIFSPLSFQGFPSFPPPSIPTLI